MTLSFQMCTKALYTLGAGLMCLKLLRSFVSISQTGSEICGRAFGSASIKPRATYSVLCPCPGSRGRWVVPGQAAVQAGKGKERAVFGSHQSIARCIPAVTVAKSRCLETDHKEREASSPTSLAFRGKKILIQKSSHCSWAYPPLIALSSVNQPNHLLNALTLHSAWMISVLGGETGGSHNMLGAGSSVAKQGVFLPRHGA